MSDVIDQAPEQDVKMTIWEHLNELRSRLVRAAIGMLITTCVAWAYRVKILAWLIRPYEKAWMGRHMPGAPELQTLSPGDVFVGYLQLSLVAGVIAAAPVIFYQLWAFISPGLYQKEKRFVVPFVVFSTTLFLSGVAFAYYVAFPFTFNYFFSLLGQVSDSGTVLTQRPTLEFYLDFATRMLLAFVVGAIATPGPEITSQIAVSGALVVLYFLSVAVSFIIARKPKDKAEDEKKS